MFFVPLQSFVYMWVIYVNITAQELADKSGFTHQYIRDLECLKLVERPRIDTLTRIAKALNIDIRQLFDDVDK